MHKVVQLLLAIPVMIDKAKQSAWNYGNKKLLLEAEMLSITGPKDKAKVTYNAAIAAARSSKFIHEQGLSCEFAGLHYKRIKKHVMARAYFHQAKGCYKEWGSQIKVDFIADQMEMLRDK